MNRAVEGPLLFVVFAPVVGFVPAGCSSVGPLGDLAGFAPQLARIERQRAASQVAGATETASRAAGGSWSSLASSPGGAGWAGRSVREAHFSLAPEGQEGTPSADEAESGRAVATDGQRAGPLPGFWETLKRDLREAPGDLWADTKAVYGSGPNLLILGLAYGGSLAIQQTGPDDTIEDSFRRGHRTFKHDWRDAFGAAGNPGTHFALAGLWYLVGQQRQDDKTYQVGKTLFSALAINGLSTLLGKAATWEDGPNGEWGAFPSGHTSSAFTFSSVMHRAYGPWVGVPLYGLSALVAYERLESSEHYFSDVVMGGVMGLVIGHTVAGEHEFELFGGQIVPYADPATGTSGVAWVRHFK